VETGSEPAEAEVEDSPVETGIDESPVKAGIDEPPVKAGVEEPPVEVAVELAEAGVEEPPVKVVVEAAVVEAALVETTTMEAATMEAAATVLRLAGAGRHEDCRPGKEQQAAEQECFPKHGVPPLLMLGVGGYIGTSCRVIPSIPHALICSL
jgi:hypothetical protein